MEAFYQQLPRVDYSRSRVARHAKALIKTFDAEFPYTAPPLDFSFKNIGNFQTFLGLYNDGKPEAEPRHARRKRLHKTEGGKFATTALKMHNNLLQEWKGFDLFLDQVLSDPEDLFWLDLSFNYLITVDDILLKCPNIKILYLHGNAIQDMKEVGKLSRLPNLISITLHGNPIESERGYRQRVLSKLPNLRALDFSRVTKEDRDKSDTYATLLGESGSAGKKHKRAKTE